MPARRSKEPKPQPVIVIDTREQRPWDFGPDVPTVTGTLPAGDYSLLGHETEVAIERKSLDDFVQTVIRDSARFARELTKLRDCRFSCIIVEGSIADVENRNYASAVHPAAIFGKCVSLCVTWRVPVLFAGASPGNFEAARARAAKWCLLFLRYFWRFGCPESPEYRGEDFGVGKKIEEAGK